MSHPWNPSKHLPAGPTAKARAKMDRLELIRKRVALNQATQPVAGAQLSVFPGAATNQVCGETLSMRDEIDLDPEMLTMPCGNDKHDEHPADRVRPLKRGTATQARPVKAAPRAKPRASAPMSTLLQLAYESEAALPYSSHDRLVFGCPHCYYAAFGRQMNPPPKPAKIIDFNRR